MPLLAGVPRYQISIKLVNKYEAYINIQIYNDESAKHNKLYYLSQYLTNLIHKICFTISFISCLYMFRAHVLIIRRSKLHYTASGIVTPIGGRLVQFGNAKNFVHRAQDGHL